MAEEETVFSSKLTYSGIFPFSDFYNFCHDWLTEETGLDITEDRYLEKISGDSKEVEVDWSGSSKITDYFKQKVKVGFVIRGMTKVKVKKGEAEINTNKGKIDIKVKGVLIKDYQGKFEVSGFNKFLRSVYEKYIIPSTVSEFKGRVSGGCDEFLTQAKAYLDLEGKK